MEIRLAVMNGMYGKDRLFSGVGSSIVLRDCRQLAYTAFRRARYQSDIVRAKEIL
jgi:hypothetical protein